MKYKFITMYGDLEYGEGNVKFFNDFHKLDGLMKADLLKDWIAELNFAYGQAIDEMEKDFEKSGKNLKGFAISEKNHKVIEKLENKSK